MKKFKLVSLIALSAALTLSCSDKNDKEIPENPGGKNIVSLVISQGHNKTRSSDGVTEGTEGTEGDINPAHGLKVYVFNADGTLDYSSGSLSDGRLTLTPGQNDTYVSSPFEVIAGEKYFFVFANDGTTGGNITAPASSLRMDEFIEQVFSVSLGADDTPSIANGNFLMGTLWKETVRANSGGTATTPAQVDVSIGRLVSKINLKEIKTDIAAESELQGTFSDARYRLGTLAKKMTNVGVFDGTSLPTAASNVLVRSAVHNSAPLSGQATDDFIAYTNDWKQEGDHFYAMENTTAKDQYSLQYFGNTTYIQVESVYTPDPSEVFDPTDLTPGTLSGTTFWTARVKGSPSAANQALAGKTIILSEDPSGVTLHQDIEAAASYPEYTDGKNYHHFAIFDPGETNEEIRNRVLRNHYYEFDVTQFNSLGSHDKDVDPQEPVPSKTTVNVNVKVKNWDKISGSVSVG